MLPVILGLTLIALDFGRVYLGYINVQNMTRIAANFAANNADAWGAKPNTAVQTQYRNQVLSDAKATNCGLPTSGGGPVVPTPMFTDTNSDGSTDLGDKVTVQLSCTFGIITPFVSSVLGGNVAVSAKSSFPVKSGMSAVIPEQVQIPPPNAAFIANDTVVTPDPITVIGPVADVALRDTSGGGPTQWAWDFGDGASSTSEDVTHTFTCLQPSCSYLVSLTASNVSGDSTVTMSVTVIGTSIVDFTSTSPSGTSPWTVTFTDSSTAGGTAYTWAFGDGQTGTGTSVSHTYTTGTYTVSHTVTYLSPIGNVTVSKQNYVVVTGPMCSVPSLIGVRFNAAQAIWQGSPYNFTGTVIRGTGAPSGNFTITAQSLTATSTAPCASNVTVNHP